MTDPGIKFICDLCGRMIEIGRPRFVFEGTIYCAYDGGTFDESVIQTASNLRKEIERLMKIAESRTEKELNDEVHYAFKLDLCRECRDKVYRLVDGRGGGDSGGRET